MLVFGPARYGDHAELRHKGRTFVLIKPATFMNLSGKAVRYWMDQENIPAERVLVITDDLALPFGAIRIKPKGGAGGHNGLTSIIELIGTEEFPRLRFGIGSDFARGPPERICAGRLERGGAQDPARTHRTGLQGRAAVRPAGRGAGHEQLQQALKRSIPLPCREVDVPLHR